jgi:exodeoxyribonuclease V gamma subunit
VLHLHRAERADALAAALAGVLAAPPHDAFATDRVAVPTRGLERWLSQRLSAHLGASADRRDGVCAGVDFPPPGALVGSALAAATGIVHEEDPWLVERTPWPLLRSVERSLGEPWLACLAEHIGAGEGAAGPRRDRRLPAVRRLASLFDRYAVHRPEMVRAWARGENLDAAGRALARDAAWQAELWRELRAEIDEPSPAERLPSACERLRDEPDVVDLPARIALFGLTRLPQSYLQVLDALGAAREVHLFLLHPSPALWGRVSAVLEAGAAPRATPPAPVSRAQDLTPALVRNRLLASWSQDSRELQLVVAAAGQVVVHHHGSAPVGETLLARIQQNVVGDRAAPGEPAGGEPDERAELAPQDASIEVHACHGRARQVEVLREVLLHLLEEDPTLEPREIVVMCPEVEIYAPLIQATFAPGEAGNAPGGAETAGAPGAGAEAAGDLRVRLADRSLRETNPLLGVLSALLELPRTRLTASEVLDLADREPVRRRFGFDDDELARVRQWIGASGIRWGLDAAHRAPFSLQAVGDGTWQAGLDRLLLGVAMADESRLFGNVLPLDDVSSQEAELSGRLAEFVERLGDAADALSRPQGAAAWRGAITTSLVNLTATSEGSSWQPAEVSRVLDELLGEAAEDAPDLSLGEVRALLARRLAGRPTRANFRTGHLTVCTLMPMRSVPHRVVCLLGLDDGAFPRRTRRDGDDLTVVDPRVGEWDPRSEDRQLLLDALLAARERLVITYSGADERTNTRCPPAVPLGELLDEIDATVRPRGGGRAREAVTRVHPLQPFDPRNFRVAAGAESTPAAGSGARGGQRAPWSFDRVALDGARALCAARREPDAFLPELLPPPQVAALELDELVQFAQRPVRSFLRSRLGIYLREEEEGPSDALPVELDGLENFSVGERLLSSVRGGISLEEAVRAERARGTLPPGDLAAPALERIRPLVEKLSREALAAAGGTSARSLELNLALENTAPRLTGTVSGVHGELILHATYARLKPRLRMASWVRLLALTAAHPDVPWLSACIGRVPQSRDGGRITVARLGPLGEDPGLRRRLARRLLEQLVELFARGMREPLPLGCASAEAFARARRGDGEAERAAGEVWTPSYGRGEAHELEHSLVHGGILPFSELLAPVPRADESGEGWCREEPTRFGRLSRALWDPLLEREELRTR